MNLTKRILATCLLPSLVGAAHAIELPDDFVDEMFLDGIEGQITSFDPRAQGRIFISEKSGIVRVAVDGEILPEPFIDLQDIVNDRVDRGMLSIAVHPQFPTTPFVYLLYTYDPPELVTNNLTSDEGMQDGSGNRVSRLVRYTADVDRDFNVAIADSEKIILGVNSTYEAIGNAEEGFDTATPSCGDIGSPLEDCLPIDELTHTIGSIRFAIDGSLYVTNGDGASFREFDSNINNLSQMTYDLDSLRGKILRIDAETGQGLPDNPYYDGNPASNRSRVVSYGLRNPYSMTLHPVTGEPYIGEVGDKSWEEINSGIGKNFGWPCYEGGPDGNLRKASFENETYCQDLYLANEAIEAPLVSWQHDGEGNASVIGDFYFGAVFPEEYTGKLFYGDYIKGWLRYADVSDPASVINSDFATDMPPMVEMRTGEDGALYYASITTKEIRRIRYIGDDSPGESGPEQGPDGETPTSGEEIAAPAAKLVEVGQLSPFLSGVLLFIFMSRRRTQRLWRV